MSGIYISGLGAVSPAGWDLASLRDALAKGHLLPSQDLPRPGALEPLRILRVPPPAGRPQFLGHPRLRRASPVTQYAAAAALEALGPRAGGLAPDTGVIVCVFSGCVNYSRRFYDETLKNPATASPLVFPETVFNAPASHIAAIIGATAINYTLVGDSGAFLLAMAIAAQWLADGQAGQCLVAGAEETDWLTASALKLFDRSKFLSEGAGAVLLTTEPSGALARLTAITDECSYSRSGGKKAALAEMRRQLPEAAALCDSTSNAAGLSREEEAVWDGWTGDRLSPKRVLGEGLMASGAWQVVAAADAIARQQAPSAVVSIAGFHQHAIGCRLERP